MKIASIEQRYYPEPLDLVVTIFCRSFMKEYWIYIKIVHEAVLADSEEMFQQILTPSLLDNSIASTRYINMLSRTYI